MTDAEAVRACFERCALDIANLVGVPDLNIEGAVDRDHLPAAVLNAAHNCVWMLSLASSILDPDGLAPLVDDADAALAAFTRGSTT
jgi:hypothetical protein